MGLKQIQYPPELLALMKMSKISITFNKCCFFFSIKTSKDIVLVYSLQLFHPKEKSLSVVSRLEENLGFCKTWILFLLSYVFI